MATRVSALEAARDLEELLDRTQERRESFVIVRGGEEVGRLIPPEKPSGLHARELLSLIRSLSWPDPEFGHDLEILHDEQSTTPRDPWAS